MGGGGTPSAAGAGTVVHIREAYLISATSLLPCFCVSLYIVPVVMMSVCRRCVGRVDVEMGGNRPLSIFKGTLPPEILSFYSNTCYLSV